MPSYHLTEYLTIQQQETYRAFIIHAPAMGHKTGLAHAIRDKLDAALLDLQAHFLAHPELASRINTFRPHDLENLLLGWDVSEPVVVVDNMDFLLNTWTPNYRREFVGMVDLRLKAGLTSKTFIFMIQTDPVIVIHELKNTRGQPRILPVTAFFDLGA